MVMVSSNRAQHATVSVWLYEQLSFRIEGKIRVSLSLPSVCL